MKHKGKSKKKIKKGKKNSKDDWVLDGSSSKSNDYHDNDEIKVRRGPRKTQEKDERLRRSRLKHEDSRRKTQIVKKMRTKVKFSDVLRSDEVEDNIETIDTDNVEKPKVIRENIRNPLPLMDRFLNVLNRSHDMLADDNDDDGSDEDDDTTEDDDSHSQASNDESIDINESIEGDDMGHDEEENLPVDEEEFVPMDDMNDDGDNESVDDHVRSTSEQFSQFFSSHDIISSSRSKSMSLLTSLSDDLSLYAPSSLPFSHPTMKCLHDIPNLHKMWRSTASMKLSKLESQLLPYLSSYMDALIEGRSYQNDAEMLRMMLLHACVHTAKSRSIVLKHNQRLKKKLMESKVLSANEPSSSTSSKKTKKSNRITQESSSAATSSHPIATTLDAVSEADELSAMEDQGYCRPRTLIICPFRSTALKCVETMMSIYGPNTTVANYDKFIDEYNYIADFDDEKAENKYMSFASRQPDDWRETFYEQNTDDDFKLGIQINVGQGKGSGRDKGVYMRLYSDFMISDMIIASPIGLRFIIENSSTKVSRHDKSSTAEEKVSAANYDFLSSIEVVIVHQADHIYMQNWDHLYYVFQHLNLHPKHLTDTIDFSRIRKYFLEEHQSQYHRQLLMTTAFIEPEIQSFYRQYAVSKHHGIRVKKNWDVDDVKCLPLLQINNSINQQLFLRINTISHGFNDLESMDDQRFKFFQSKILTPLLRADEQGILIITPKYFDFVRVRNELIRLQADAAFVCEYSRETEITRGRSRFYNKQKKILLYSGRAHFFRRFQMRGARQVVFYSMPEYPHFYSEITNNMVSDSKHASSESSSASDLSCVTIFSTYEQMALERIVGRKRCQHMIASDKTSFMFK